MSTVLPPPRSVFQHLSNLAATERRRRQLENDRILREGNELLPQAMARCLPSNRAVHPSRSDIINRERYLPAQRGFAASLRARGNVRPAPRGAIPGVCAARKARLENSAANCARYLSQGYAGQDKVRDPSAPKPTASSPPIIWFGN